MSCNGSNHKLGCNCGWGGVFHGLGLGVGEPYWGRSDSYTNPNARCPYCSALVYFYKSPSGGSVYFDELGPPWPKHPCMDAGGQSLRTVRAEPNLAMPLWTKTGWHPMKCESIEKLKGASGVAVLAIGQENDRKQLFARIPKALISCDSPILWRRVDGQRGHYEISTLDLSDIGFKEICFEAFDNLVDIKKQIRVESLNANIKAFDIRMARLKQELLNSTPISGLEAKLDAELAKFQQLLRDYGDPAEISQRASDALKIFVKREIQAKKMEIQANDMTQRAQVIYNDFLAAEIGLRKRLVAVGVDVKPFLRTTSRRAAANGLSFVEGKALLKDEAQRIVNTAERRHRAAEELRSFITELCSTSDQLGGEGKAILKNVVAKALHKDYPDIPAIKELLLHQARKYLEEAAVVMALLQEKARQAKARAAEKNRKKAIYDELFVEGARLEKELAAYGVDLKPYLRMICKKAVANELFLDEGRALLMEKAQSIVNAATMVEARLRATEELRGFIVEICSSSNELEGKGKALLDKTLVAALRKDHPDISAIKELLRQQARKYLEEATVVLARRQEKARQVEDRAAGISSRIESLVNLHPAMDRKELVNALARMTYSKSSLEQINTALDEIVGKWIATRPPTHGTVIPTSPQRYGSQASAPPKSTTRDAGGRGRPNGGMDRMSGPFNAALGDRLRLALEQVGKSG